jgi:uncharacterized damage-inducible protein DinB
MQPGQASFLLNYFAETFDYEAPITAKVIAAFPNGQENYSPDPVSTPALKLAWHIVSSELWMLAGVTKGEFSTEEAALPADITTFAQVVAWYRKNVLPAMAKLKTFSGEQLAQPINFYNVYNLPAVSYLSFMIRHSVHHRGQLAAYLRPAGGKVPSIYGGSADEAFQPPA